MREPIGVSILTNGDRLQKLKSCIQSLLANCYYRPLIIGIFDNGSTGEGSWNQEDIGAYGVEGRIELSKKDLGCAVGTNRVANLVKDCKYTLHLESDFVHIPQDLSGEDKMWLHRAVDFMDTGDCDYLYLRRMINEVDIGQHWWAQWMQRVDHEDGKYIRCPGFWWSNNPHLRRNDAVYKTGCLPLDESIDGKKGTSGWSKPELSAQKPPNAWIHRWGMFVHDIQPNDLTNKGCGKSPIGCKYGFFKNPNGDKFCQCCQGNDFRDMSLHYDRFCKTW